MESRPRWKVLLQLAAAIFCIGIGSWMLSEGMDILPVFAITNWAAVIFGLLIAWRGWDLFHDSWAQL